MNPQETVRPQEALGRRFRCRLGQESGRQQNGYEDPAKSCLVCLIRWRGSSTRLDTPLETRLIGRLVRGRAFLPEGEPRRQRDGRIPRIPIHRSCRLTRQDQVQARNKGNQLSAEPGL